MDTPLPTGTITFLFTDVEGSTKLAQVYPDGWENIRDRHNAILRSAMDTHNGYVFQIIGDAFCVAFNTANEALRAAIKSQMDLHAEDWGDSPIKVRMGIHTGQAQVRENGDYQGYLSMSRVQRLMSAGHGGQILISKATQELIQDELPKNVSLRDMGERRLKDLFRPEHIYQLDISGLPVDFPALRTLERYRHNLPTQLTSFIGREKEIAEIQQALADHRLITLTGSGGAGKTRLSLHVAADSLDLFPDGVWFVELAPLSNPDLVPQTILTAAGMQTQQGKSALESLADFLREKTSLLVLDNCEHLLDACVITVDTLVNTAPNLKIMVSSREALGIRGEQSWRVSSLTAPDIKHLPPLDELSQYEAVRMFIDRALLVQSHFTVTNENAPVVAQICHRLDGIPLAIELAAARLRMLSVEQIADRLDDRFRLLTGGSRTSLPRQQTLRALIDWSYDLLTESERILLRRLAVFTGGFTLEAAEQVCAGVGQDDILSDDVMDLLTHLADKSLLIVEEQPSHLRYRLLETVWQYAREKLAEANDGEKIRYQHLAYFLNFAEEADSYIMRKEQLEWLEKLNLEHDNLRSALEWALQESPDKSIEAGARLANALSYYWYLQGYWVDGREFFARILATSAHSIATKTLATAYYEASMFEDDWRQRLELCDKGLALCRELGDKSGTAEALLRKGMSVAYYLDYSLGKSLIEESLNLYSELHDITGIAITKYHLGQIASIIEKDISTARQYYEESLSLGQESGHRRMIALAGYNLGCTYLLQGDLPMAQKLFEKSLSLGEELGDKHGKMMYLDVLGIVALGQGKYEQAEELIAESLAIARELGSREAIAIGLIDLARVACFQNDLERSSKFLKESLFISKEIDDHFIIADSLGRLGMIFRLQGNHVKARAVYLDALRIASKMPDCIDVVAYLLVEFASLSVEEGKAKQSITLFAAGEVLRESIHEVLLPVEQIEIDRNYATARGQLDENEFNAAFSQGHSMSLEQAVAFALETLQE